MVIIQVCMNDLKTIPLFSERKQEIITDCEENIEMLVQKSLDLNATVILITVFPTSGNVPLARRLVWSNDGYEAIKEVNRFILSLKNEKVIVFDTASILSDSDGNLKPEYVHDLLHLNDKGYEILNIELVKILAYLK
jgi:lysophospholipase L1-like esterase